MQVPLKAGGIKWYVLNVSTIKMELTGHTYDFYVSDYWYCLHTFTVNFSGSNTDGSFTTAVSNSFLSPLEKEKII